MSINNLQQAFCKGKGLSFVKELSAHEWNVA
jgi:hypothetical protein